MMSKSSHKVRAIVLRTIDYGESDRIVTFLTEDFGKLKGIAKGARRSRKRFVNALELFSSSRVLFSRRSAGGLSLIESADVISHHPGIREDLEKTLVAAYISELVEGFTPEGKRNAGLYRLLEGFLGFLDREVSRPGVERFFEVRLLKALGYDPHLGSCMTCRKALDEMAAPFFIAGEGGVRCQACLGGAARGLSVSPGSLKTLLAGQTMELGKLSRLSLSGQAARECRQILGAFIEHLLGKPVKSLKVLDDMRKTVL